MALGVSNDSLLYSLHMRWNRGFTVLELIIVLLVFGLVVTLGVVSLNSARRAQRDALRLSSVSVLRSALNVYWQQHGRFPESNGVDLAAPGTNTDVFTGEGFVAREAARDPIHLQQVPVGPTANEYFFYKGGLDGYSIRFRTESRTSLGEPNVYYAHKNGIDQVDEEK